jgi:hypothetical protein
MTHLLLLALLCALLSVAFGAEVCGLSCTKDASICKGSCGSCLSENRKDFFCGNLNEEQLTAANNAHLLKNNITATSTGCGTCPYCESACTCNHYGDGCWPMKTFLGTNAKIFVPPGYFGLNKN